MISNIKFKEKPKNSNCLNDTDVNTDISNWVQYGKRVVEKERSALKQINANTLQLPETSSSISHSDDASCASFSTSISTETNDLVYESCPSSLSSFVDSSLLSPTSETQCNETSNSKKCTFTFKKPSHIKGKFNPYISITKNSKNREPENDNFEESFINLNKAVVDHLNSKKYDTPKQNDPDVSFCNLLMAELSEMKDEVKQSKKREIIKILWKKE